MRVGIDISPLTAARTGVGNYCYYLLRHMMGLDSSVAFRGFASGTKPMALEALEGRLPVRHLPIPTRALYKSWEWFHAPKVDSLLGGVDIYHATNYFLPPVKRAKRVLTIHDLAFLAVPELCSPRIVGPFSEAVRRYAPHADRIMAYSESTRRDIVKYLDLPAERISVAPMAVDEAFQPVSLEEAQTTLKSKYGIESPFLLFVSTIEPRKNVVGLLRAFEQVLVDIPHNLVMIGSIGWNAEDAVALMESPRLKPRIIRPGFVPHMELPPFYCAADAFVFPTHYEGFGLPLLEALTCGCPVVSADNSSVKEVVGEAALLSNSHDTAAIAENIRRIVSDAALREELRAKGHEQALKFSWDDCARVTLDSYQEVLG